MEIIETPLKFDDENENFLLFHYKTFKSGFRSKIVCTNFGKLVYYDNWNDRDELNKIDIFKKFIIEKEKLGYKIIDFNITDLKVAMQK